jgi:N utilization substance protein A
MRGSRVQAVVGELQGEKIDIIPWSDDEATFIVNALQPAEVAKVVLDEEAERIEVVVPDDQLSLAIGRRGQNVRLASQLTGWDIDIMTEADESERRQKEFETQTAMFIEALDVDEMIANLLVSEGFSDLEDVAFVPFEEIASIDGFDDDTASELQTRAVEYLEAQNAAHLEAARAAGMQEDLIEFDGLSPPMLAALAAEGILTLQDFAELADWELAGGYTVVNGQRTKDDGILENHDVGEDEAQTLIMTARVVLGMMTAEEAFPVAEEVEEEIEEEEGDEPASELSDAEAVFADFDADGKQAN